VRASQTSFSESTEVTMNGYTIRLFRPEPEFQRWSYSGIVKDGLAIQASMALDKFFEKRGMISEFRKGFNNYARRKG